MPAIDDSSTEMSGAPSAGGRIDAGVEHAGQRQVVEIAVRAR